MGKYAIFSDTGTGKTIMQLSWAHQVEMHENRPVLILAPLAVSAQTIDEGLKFGIEVKKLNPDELSPTSGVWITNYEQFHKIDMNDYCGIVLDESSILKNEMGKFRELIIEKCKQTPYKLACTATPSPNDPMELGNHAEFLDIMSFNEMLAMYFVHDGGDTSKWRLKGHGKSKFYEFVSQWSIMLMKPQDIGFEMAGVS